MSKIKPELHTQLFLFVLKLVCFLRSSRVDDKLRELCCAPKRAKFDHAHRDFNLARNCACVLLDLQQPWFLLLELQTCYDPCYDYMN